MPNLGEQLIDLARSLGAAASPLLAIFCAYLMVQLERERRDRMRDRADTIAFFERILTRL